MLKDIIQITQSHWKLYGFVRNIIGKHIIIGWWSKEPGFRTSRTDWLKGGVRLVV